MTELEQQLQSARAEAEAALAACSELSALDQLKSKYLGRSGTVSAALEQLGKLPKEEKPRIGKLANEIKNALTAAITAKRDELEAKVATSGPQLTPHCRGDGNVSPPASINTDIRAHRRGLPAHGIRR